MNLHEYQAKQLFKEYGLPVPIGSHIHHVNEVASVISTIPGDQWIIKCQVHSGGRGKAGGVQLFSKTGEGIAFAKRWLGNNLITAQSDEKGQPVKTLLIEACSSFKKELYLGAIVDRTKQSIVFMASTEGGVDIEQVATVSPEKIHKVTIDPIVGAQPFQGRQLAFQLGLKGDQIKQFTHIFLGLARFFQDHDVALLEVNPLAILDDDSLLCLDAKVVIDNNAAFRQQRLEAMRDKSQEDERECHASDWELNYVALDGNIGCMVNGAGLAMGTMDLVNFHGGKPANFLDVGGGATKERVVEAFKIILSDANVKVILVNIFGGIVRCDLIAQGIIDATKEVGVTVPVVVRLEGNNAPLGLKLLADSGLNIIAADSLTNAAKMAVSQAVAVSEGGL